MEKEICYADDINSIFSATALRCQAYQSTVLSVQRAISDASTEMSNDYLVEAEIDNIYKSIVECIEKNRDAETTNHKPKLVSRTAIIPRQNIPTLSPEDLQSKLDCAAEMVSEILLKGEANMIRYSHDMTLLKESFHNLQEAQLSDDKRVFHHCTTTPRTIIDTALQRVNSAVNETMSRMANTMSQTKADINHVDGNLNEMSQLFLQRFHSRIQCRIEVFLNRQQINDDYKKICAETTRSAALNAKITISSALLLKHQTLQTQVFALKRQLRNINKRNVVQGSVLNECQASLMSKKRIGEASIKTLKKARENNIRSFDEMIRTQIVLDTEHVKKLKSIENQHDSKCHELIIRTNSMKHEIFRQLSFMIGRYFNMEHMESFNLWVPLTKISYQCCHVYNSMLKEITFHRAIQSNIRQHYNNGIYLSGRLQKGELTISLHKNGYVETLRELFDHCYITDTFCNEISEHVDTTMITLKSPRVNYISLTFDDCKWMFLNK